MHRAAWLFFSVMTWHAFRYYCTVQVLFCAFQECTFVLLDSLYSDVTSCFSGSAYLSFVALHSSSKYNIMVNGFMAGQDLKGRMALETPKTSNQCCKMGSCTTKTMKRAPCPGLQYVSTTQGRGGVCAWVRRCWVSGNEGNEWTPNRSLNHNRRCQTLGMHGPLTCFHGKSCWVFSDLYSMQGCFIPYRVLFPSSHIYASWHRFLCMQWLMRGSLFTKCLLSAHWWTGGISELRSLLVVHSKIEHFSSWCMHRFMGTKFPWIWNLSLMDPVLFGPDGCRQVMFPAPVSYRVHCGSSLCHRQIPLSSPVKWHSSYLRQPCAERIKNLSYIINFHWPIHDVPQWIWLWNIQHVKLKTHTYCSWATMSLLFVTNETGISSRLSWHRRQQDSRHHKIANSNRALWTMSEILLPKPSYLVLYTWSMDWRKTWITYLCVWMCQRPTSCCCLIPTFQCMALLCTAVARDNSIQWMPFLRCVFC